MPRPNKSRMNPSERVSDIDRKESKKNVALSKASQQAEMAQKAFEKRRKDFQRQLSQVLKLQKDIDKLVKERKEKQVVEQRFLGQVKKAVEQYKSLSKQVKIDSKSLTSFVENPQTLSKMVQVAPQPNVGPPQKMYYGDVAMMLAVMVVILKSYLEIQFKKK